MSLVGRNAAMRSFSEPLQDWQRQRWSDESHVDSTLQRSPIPHTKLRHWRPPKYFRQTMTRAFTSPNQSVRIHQNNLTQKPPLNTTVSSEVSDMEKALTTLPPKRWQSLTRNLRWSVFSVYRRLNCLVLLLNIVTIIVLGIRHRLVELPTSAVATAVAVNIIVAVLIRQELVINALFALFGKCPRSLPLRIRRLAAKIYHLGGVHSGAGIAATVWFGVYNVVLARQWAINMDVLREPGLFVVTGTLDCLLLSILVLAHPRLRAKFHNTFEMVHRFAGWAAVILFWVHMLVLAEVERKSLIPKPTLAQVTIRSPVFYCLLIVTVSLIIPWLRLRRVPVHAEPLSAHAIRLHFTHENLPLCAAPKISDSPLREWHAFAGIPEESGHGYSLIVSNAGDWTSSLIKSPPTSMWVRGMPPRGVLHLAPIFRRVVLVATGSGIGPVLSLLFARNLQCRILWSAPKPESTYQKTIINHVLLGDPHAVIIDTTRFGRPDLVQEAYHLYKSSQAEAVFVISNPRVTRKVVYGLETRGVPIFAPIFDS